MAAVTGAALATAAATAYSANRANKAAGDANKAAGAANALTQQQWEQTQANLAPYLGLGADATARLQQLQSGDMSGFYESPDYQFNLSQGLGGIDRGAAARGSLFSGGTDADRIRFASGLASQEYGNFFSRLQQSAGMGQNAAVGAGNFGQQAAQSQGQNLLGAAGARASAYGAQSDAVTGGINNLVGLLGMQRGNSTYGQKPQTTWPGKK